MFKIICLTILLFLLIIIFSAEAGREEKWVAKGNELFSEGKYKEAIVFYNKALIDVKDKYAFLGLGKAHYYLNDWDEAREYFDRVISIDDRSFDAWYYKVLTACFGLRDDNLAIDYFDRALSINPYYKHAWYYRGNSYANMGNYDMAVSSYNRALQLDPDFVKAKEAKENIEKVRDNSGYEDNNPVKTVNI